MTGFTEFCSMLSRDGVFQRKSSNAKLMIEFLFCVTQESDYSITCFKPGVSSTTFFSAAINALAI